MEDINNYIKENDTDNVTLKKLKELGTKLTGQEEVQGETIAEVLDFINANYSGGGSGSKTIVYANDSETIMYAYKDEGFTEKYTSDELFEIFLNGALITTDKQRYHIAIECISADGITTIVAGYIQLFSSEYTGS